MFIREDICVIRMSTDECNRIATHVSVSCNVGHIYHFDSLKKLYSGLLA